MSTKKLAKELGLLRRRTFSSSEFKKNLLSSQIFSYLIVIDFESTCWREKNNYSQEIIEFPAVLLNTSTGEVESEFHTYVQPQEHPTLSEFCTELTGIMQSQVEAAIPLQICVSRFSRWLQNLRTNMCLVFPQHPHTSPSSAAPQKLCTFLTWSDWDLGVCLQYECRRKQIHKPDVLNTWIDLRSTYRLFYDRKPKGLNGALQDLGIQFAGREHSGLDDARNTAQLAARMMGDGCVMKVTRSLTRAPSVVKHTLGGPASDAKREITNPHKQQETADHLDMKSAQRFLPTCQSLVSPTTLLGGGTVITGNSPSPHSSSSLVLCPTTVSCLSSRDHLDQPSADREAPRLLEEEERAEVFLLETEESCGSYDQVVLGGSGDVVSGESGFNYASDFDGDEYLWEESDHTSLEAPPVDNMKERVSETMLKAQRMSCKTAVVALPPHTIPSQVNMRNSRNEIWQQSKLIKPDTQAAKRNQLKKGLKMSMKVQENPKLPQRKSKTHTRCSFARAGVYHFNRSPKSSFSIYTEPLKPSGGSFRTTKRVLSSLSANVPNSEGDCSLKGVRRVTFPLCSCGRRAKRQAVSNRGPNHGRGFYCCAIRRSGGTGGMQKGCEFFKWESAVIKTSSVASAAAARSSVSLCQVNASLSRQQPRLSRKSC